MRLLVETDGELTLTQHVNTTIPPYAILSHTWGASEDEVGYDDIANTRHRSPKSGFSKLEFCLRQAKQDGLLHGWVDTCCIKKSDAAEFSEAINSMFRWYSDAQICYVYLTDVSVKKRDGDGVSAWKLAFQGSRWFTRGWTLQELLAPKELIFYSREGERLGSRIELAPLVQEITGIPESALLGAPILDFSVIERKRWAARRQTTKVEDKWYCLLGIFDVSMPIYYGEKEEVTHDRLNEAIVQRYRRTLENANELSNTAALPQNSNSLESRNLSAPEYRRTALLESLRFDQMDSRRTNIRREHRTTCAWFLKHPSFLKWRNPDERESHRGFLWINGKPGAGKSTLIKYAHSKAEKELASDEILISFFFNARGEQLEKTTLGMYRALLSQIFTKAPSLQEVLDSVLVPEPNVSASSVWTNASLQDLLAEAITKLDKRHLTCYIDALDECDEQEVREMVHFFEALADEAYDNGLRLQICFASRHYPNIRIPHAEHMSLEHTDGHKDDLAKYIRTHLRAGKGRLFEEVRAEVEAKANGVFMWAVLVVPILNKEFEGGRHFAVKKRLKEIPEKLGELFGDILDRDQSNLPDLLLCLQWILFARRPLTREEFYYAMITGLSTDPEYLKPWDPEFFPVEAMDQFVLNSSKGLAELTRTKSPTVQFIHESVRDFLLKDKGLERLWPTAHSDVQNSIESLSQDRIKQCCWRYLSVDVSSLVTLSESLPKSQSDESKELARAISSKFPFLKYATANMLYHSNKAALEVAQGVFLSELDRERWIRFHNLFELHGEIRRYGFATNMLYILADNNQGHLIGAYDGLRTELNVSTKGRYRYPFFAALAGNCREALKALLFSLGEDQPVVEKALQELLPGHHKAFSQSQSPLCWALQSRSLVTSELLLRGIHFSPLDEKEIEQIGIDALDIAFGFQDDLVVLSILNALCLWYGKQSKSHIYNRIMKDRYGSKALLLGVCKHNLDLMTLSFHEGVLYKDVTPVFHNAALDGRLEVMRLLLENGLDINAMNADGTRAVHTIARLGDAPAFEVLVGHGAEEHVTNNEGETPLLLAACFGHIAVVELLVRHGAEVNVFSNKRETPLMLAARNGHGKVVEFLVYHGAQVYVTNQQEETPLMLAAHSGDLLTVKTLLNRKANLNQEDSRGYTVLHMVVDHEIAKLLIEHGAPINASGHDGRTALHVAVMRDDLPLCRLLLENGANIEANDAYSWTPLSYASLEYTFIYHMQDAMSSHAYQDYQMQLMLLEQQNKERLLMARREQPEQDGKVQLEARQRIAATAIEELPSHPLSWYRDRLSHPSLYGFVLGRNRNVVSMSIAEYLVLKGAQVNVSDTESITPLMRAAGSGLDAVVRVLLQHGARIDAMDTVSCTALIFSVISGKHSTASLLLEEGAAITSSGGFSALTVATRMGNRELLHVMEMRLWGLPND